MRASMPVGEPSLSMQGSLPPLFLSVVLILSPSLSISALYLIFLSPVKPPFFTCILKHFQFLYQTKYLSY